MFPLLSNRRILNEHAIGEIQAEGTIGNHMTIDERRYARKSSHLVVLLLDQCPVNRAREDELEIRVGVRFPCLQTISCSLLKRKRLARRDQLRQMPDQSG